MAEPHVRMLAPHYPRQEVVHTQDPLPKTARFYELMLAGRLLRSRRSLHLSLVTAMSVAGIALGVAALIVVLAVNTGFQVAFQDRILATYPHLVIMKRGVDLREWRDVQDKLRNVAGVRVVAPATYDDMMLSAAGGRAGAIVRGVPASTVNGLPEGAVVAGKLDTQGEFPVLKQQKSQLRVVSGIASARHVVAIGDDFAAPFALLPPGVGSAALVVFDANGCGQKPAEKPEDPGVYLLEPSGLEPLRRSKHAKCALVASWEVLGGQYLVRWQADGAQREQTVELHEGETLALILHGPHATAVLPPTEPFSPAVAAVAPVPLDHQPLTVTLPDGMQHTLTEPQWLGFAGELPAMALGEGLAKRLQVKVGDEVRAVSPLRGLDSGDAGQAQAQSASGRFRVAAIIRTGFFDHDQRLALCDFAAAQRFLGRGDLARWVEVRVDDPILAAERADSFRAALEPTELGELLSDAKSLHDRLGAMQKDNLPGMTIRAPTNTVAVVDNWVSAFRGARQLRPRNGSAWRVIDWQEMNRNIFDAARMQKIAMSLFPFIIVLVAALNVVGTQAVVVHERAREIAIIRAMGGTRRSVSAIFLVQGLVVGLLGTALGLGIGGLACLLLDAVGYPLDPQVYLISRLPVLIEASTFVIAGVAATLLAFAAAWWSAQRAATRAPVEALRRLD